METLTTSPMSTPSTHHQERRFIPYEMGSLLPYTMKKVEESALDNLNKIVPAGNMFQARTKNRSTNMNTAQDPREWMIANDEDLRESFKTSGCTDFDKFVHDKYSEYSSGETSRAHDQLKDARYER